MERLLMQQVNSAKAEEVDASIRLPPSIDGPDAGASV
jgi:hypothetical protein